MFRTTRVFEESQCSRSKTGLRKVSGFSVCSRDAMGLNASRAGLWMVCALSFLSPLIGQNQSIKRLIQLLPSARAVDTTGDMRSSWARGILWLSSFTIVSTQHLMYFFTIIQCTFVREASLELGQTFNRLFSRLIIISRAKNGNWALRFPALTLYCFAKYDFELRVNMIAIRVLFFHYNARLLARWCAASKEDGVSVFSTPVSLNIKNSFRIPGQSKRLLACQSYYVLEFSLSRSRKKRKAS